jgi:hypothetical protein
VGKFAAALTVRVTERNNNPANIASRTLAHAQDDKGEAKHSGISTVITGLRWSTTHLPVTF